MPSSASHLSTPPFPSPPPQPPPPPSPQPWKSIHHSRASPCRGSAAGWGWRPWSPRPPAPSSGWRRWPSWSLPPRTLSRRESRPSRGRGTAPRRRPCPCASCFCTAAARFRLPWRKERGSKWAHLFYWFTVESLVMVEESERERERLLPATRWFGVCESSIRIKRLLLGKNENKNKLLLGQTYCNRLPLPPAKTNL